MADAATLLPPNASVFERSAEQVSAARWLALDADALRRAKDPWTCPEHLLGFLAFERSVDIWDESWPALKKRSVIASAPADHRLKGTAAGLRRYIAIAGGELVQLVTPPGGLFASPNLSPAEWNALLARHPRLRITLARRTGTYRTGAGLMPGASFLGAAFLAPDRADRLLGRRAQIVENSVAYDLAVHPASRGGRRFETVSLPGDAGAGLFAGDGFLAQDFVGGQRRAPRRLAFAIEGRSPDAAVQISTVQGDADLRSPNFRRESDRGEARTALFVGRFPAACHLAPDRAADLIADVLYFHDPKIAVPQVAALGFVNHARLAVPHHRAEALVDQRRRIDPHRAFFASRGFVGRTPLAREDQRRRRLLLDAISRSSRVSDRIAVSFQTHRPRRLGDGLPLDGTTALGAAVPNRL